MASDRPGRPAPGRPARPAWRRALVPALAAAVVVAAWFAWRTDSDAGAAPAAPPPVPAAALPMPALEAPDRGPLPAALGPLNAQARDAALHVARERLARATQTLASYRAATRYPFTSRPAAEHSDQMYPRRPVTREMPLRVPHGAPTPGLHVRASQESIFVSGADSVRFTVAVVDDQGAPVPTRIVRAIAYEPDSAAGNAPSGMATPIVPVSFVDDGTGGDAAAGDGTFTGTLSPAAQGFANFPGSIRTELTLQAGDAQGYVAFDVVYTPAVPATWTGAKRELVEGGSLDFYLGVTVNQPGRYVVTGRVDDANGQPFALVTFNDQLAAGTHEVKLPVFGLLVRDQAPAFPLTLRDVDGFLLLPDAYPDRSLMPRLDGPVLTTRPYTAAAFSNAPWDSEEKDRYLAEYQKDVDQAQQQVDRLSGGAGGAAAPGPAASQP